MKSLLILLLSVCSVFGQNLKWEIPITHPNIAFDRVRFSDPEGVAPDGAGGCALSLSYFVDGTNPPIANRLVWISATKKVLNIDTGLELSRIFRITTTYLYTVLEQQNGESLIRRYRRATGGGFTSRDTPLRNPSEQGSVLSFEFSPKRWDPTGFFTIQSDPSSSDPIAIRRLTN